MVRADRSRANASGIAVDVAKFPWGALSRAITIDRPDGLTKLILEPKSGRVLGVGIAGSGAGSSLPKASWRSKWARQPKTSTTIHPHPTLSESLMESAGLLRPKHPRLQTKA